jgi:hypothetical protein
VVTLLLHTGLKAAEPATEYLGSPRQVKGPACHALKRAGKWQEGERVDGGPEFTGPLQEVRRSDPPPNKSAASSGPPGLGEISSDAFVIMRELARSVSFQSRSRSRISEDACVCAPPGPDPGGIYKPIHMIYIR